MAAGALAAVLGGSNKQVENAAEIGMEHNLWLTCDPVGGPRAGSLHRAQYKGSRQSHNGCEACPRGDGQHIVSLDLVIETMRQTGEHMALEYKETSLGGLAVNVLQC